MGFSKATSRGRTKIGELLEKHDPDGFREIVSEFFECIERTLAKVQKAQAEQVLDQVASETKGRDA